LALYEVQTIKNLEFVKIQDSGSCHLEYHKNCAYWSPTFHKSYMADSSNLENCFKIFCSYTMTHYTNLAIKQQIQTLRTVNSDGSKSTKITNKVVLLSITLTFKQRGE